MNLDQKAISALRVHAIDAIQKAKSGHPGMALDAAPTVFELFAHQMQHNPANPNWLNRDRFILSAGHVSALLYSTLYLFGYGLKAEDMAAFRQWQSRTPGHPELDVTPGVEMSTGPLGQGLATAVGFAMAEQQLAAHFNSPEEAVIDHYTYALCGDGCLQEGVSSEAASLAGNLGLGKLITIYDRNGITIEGQIDLTFSEDVAARYRAYGWQVLEVKDANDLKAIGQAIQEAKACQDQPSLIIVNSTIAFASPLAGSEKTHGAPLGEDNVRLTKEALAWDPTLEPFSIPNDLEQHLTGIRQKLAAQEEAWNALFDRWSSRFPERRQEFDNWQKQLLPDLRHDEAFWAAPDKAEATRVSSGKILNYLSAVCPYLVGGSADLGPSNNSILQNCSWRSKENPDGRNIHYGVREFAMACATNGMNLHGGLYAYCATFFVFSDYMKNALRLAAIMKLPGLFVLTHDSIGVGEDGPTHEPIEQLTMLRATPDIYTFRPADYRETAAAYLFALESRKTTALCASRQNLPQLEGSGLEALKGAYALQDSENPDLVLMASGSEVHLALEAATALSKEGYAIRVLSVPCMELFLEQEDHYREALLGRCKIRIAIEAGATMPWYRLTGLKGAVIGIDHFGASAPAGKLFEAYGITTKAIIEKAHALLQGK